MKPASRFDDLPLFADDQAIGAALLGAKRAGEWASLAPLLEARGLPKIDHLHGGRYTPAVKAFYDNQSGLSGARPTSPDGVEDLNAWKTRRPKHRA